MCTEGSPLLACPAMLPHSRQCCLSKPNSRGLVTAKAALSSCGHLQKRPLLCCPGLLVCTMPLFKHRKGKEPASTRTELRPDLTQPSTAPPPGTGSPVPQKEVVRVRAKAEPETAQPAEVMVQVMAPPLPPSSEVRVHHHNAQPNGDGGAQQG